MSVSLHTDFTKTASVTLNPVSASMKKNPGFLSPKTWTSSRKSYTKTYTGSELHRAVSVTDVNDREFCLYLGTDGRAAR